MKIFFDWLKDFVYDSIDYIIMFVIIVSVVVIIGWRLDVLFANDATDIPHKNVIISKEDVPSGDSTQIENPPKKDNEGEIIVPKDEPSDVVESPDDIQNPSNIEIPVKVETPPVIVQTVKITIPAGSLPSKIGSILESSGLVSNKNDFVKKAQQLKLDTKLKSGDFSIAKNLTIEEILNIITK